MEENWATESEKDKDEITVSTKEIPKSSIKEAEATVTEKAKNDPGLKQWDPMASHYYSRGNSFGHRLVGNKNFDLKKEPEDLSKVPCRFFDGIRCWRKNCPFLHEDTRFERKLVIKLKKVVLLSCVTNLQEKNSIAAIDCIMEVTVTHIKHPWKFYVNSEKAWGCSCLNFGPEKGQTCLRDDIEQKLTDYLVEHFQHLVYPEYIPFQLVAVKRLKADQTVFVRGVVQEATDGTRDLDEVKVQLLDTGEKLIVRRKDICGLPRRFSDSVAALAYQCKLFRVSPLMHRWTAQATQLFRKVVLGKKCILIVKRTTKASVEGVPQLFENSNPYEVELRVTCDDPLCLKYHDVAKVMASHGHGVLWARNPYYGVKF